MKRSFSRFGVLVWIAAGGCSLGAELPTLPPAQASDADVVDAAADAASEDVEDVEEGADAEPEDAALDSGDAGDAAQEDGWGEEVGCEALACGERFEAAPSCGVAGCEWRCAAGFGDANGDLNALEVSDGCECAQQARREDQVCDGINQSCSSSADTCCADREWVHRLPLGAGQVVERLDLAVSPGVGLALGWLPSLGRALELRSFSEDGAALGAASLPRALPSGLFALGSRLGGGFAAATRLDVAGEQLELHLMDAALVPQAGSPVVLSSEGSIGSLTMLELPGQEPGILALRYNVTGAPRAGCAGIGWCAVVWGYLPPSGDDPGRWVELSVTPTANGTRSRIRAALQGDHLAITWLELQGAGPDAYAIRGWVVNLANQESLPLLIEPSVPLQDYALLAASDGFRVISLGLDSEGERQVFQRRFDLGGAEPTRTPLLLRQSFVQATALEDGRALLLTRAPFASDAPLWAEAFAVDGEPSALPTAPIYAQPGRAHDQQVLRTWGRRGLLAAAQHSAMPDGTSAIDLIAVEPDALVPACALPALRAP